MSGNFSMLAKMAGQLLVAGWFLVGLAAGQTTDTQVIEVTAKKYEYSPAPIRVKAGSKVQL